MSVTINEMPRPSPAPAKDVLVRQGQLAIVIGGDYDGHVLLRTCLSIVDLTNPCNISPSTACTILVELLPAGTSITYISEV